MKHKTITIHSTHARHRVRLHSIDGRIWCAESPRRAACLQLELHERQRREYTQLRRLIEMTVTDEMEGTAI